ncbi:DUF927 domain-containing protein [Burkholderia vietnamiensis]|uniref:DUF927 domain-containing protein n=1 Tax=Burkholderia vietnamiensis TaxID=60552 RepID=UPI001BA04406|nr:DUF927 domain-containing protein [Burkholderia vietnamiensis]MBR8007440.1 DUF927 domain-containing protein [Burkholderia vietnamiensis]
MTPDFVAPSMKRNALSREKPYVVTDDGLYARSADRLVRICSPLHPHGYAIDSNGSGPARIIRIQTLAGWKVIELPETLLAQPRDLELALINHGVELESSVDAITHIFAYLKSLPKLPLYKRVRRDGWINPDGSGGYAFGEKLYDAAGITPVIRPAEQDQKPECKGHVEEWRACSRLLEANPMPLSTICFALAAPLLRPLGHSSFCVSIVGQSSSGKSTLLRLAQSLLTSPQPLATWAGTANGLLARAVEHNDLPFILDEIGQAVPRDLSQLIYDLTNGTGKLRATPDGSAATPSSVSTVIVTAGEESVFDRMNRVGQAPTGGHRARFITLTVEGQQGIVSGLHGSSDSASFVQNLNALIRETYGAAWPPYVQYVATHLDELKTEYARVRDRIRQGIAADFTLDDFDNIESRVLDHFAIAAFAGYVAVDAKVIDLPKTAIGQAMRACFANWFDGMSSSRSVSAKVIIREVQAHVRKHQHKMAAFADFEKHEVRQPFGYRHASAGESVLLIRPSALEPLKSKYGAREFHDALRSSDWLISGSGARPTKQVKVPQGDGEKFNAYVLRESLLL